MRPHADIPPLREAFQQFLRLLRLIRPFWGMLAKGMVLGLVLGLVGMITPYLSKLLIDEVYPSQNVTLMHILVGGIFAVTVATSVLGAIRSYYTLHVTSRLGNATSLMFFNHLQHLSARFFDEHRVGEIMSRFADVRSSLSSISNIFSTIFVQGAYLLLVPPFLFLLQWKLALLALVTVPLTVLTTMLSARILRHYHKRTAEAFADLSAYQVEVLSHIRTLKVLAQEHRIYRRAQHEIRGAMQQQLRAGALSHGFGFVTGLVNALGMALLTWFAWRLILGGEMSLGDYIAFMAYVGYFMRPLQQFTGAFANFQQTAVNLGRMFEYLDSPAEQDPALAYEPLAPVSGRIEGRIELSDVHFGYDAAKPVLRGVDLLLQPGTVTAVVGASGAGKSSLLRLICRMEEPQKGEIRLDGRPIALLPISDLRRQVSVVWQEFSLLQGTIWENLTLGLDKEPPRERVDAAVRICRMDEVIEALPAGYDTLIAEWGASLSGGQRQRLALARALLRETPILLLDEATSNIDLEAEAEILRNLFAGRTRRTMLFITHRVASAAWADQVCILEEGEVAGVGTHEELLRSCAPYQRLHRAPSFEEQHRLRVVQPHG